MTGKAANRSARGTRDTRAAEIDIIQIQDQQRRTIVIGSSTGLRLHGLVAYARRRAEGRRDFEKGPDMRAKTRLRKFGRCEADPADVFFQMIIVRRRSFLAQFGFCRIRGYRRSLDQLLRSLDTRYST